jgi:hypothetical protein
MEYQNMEFARLKNLELTYTFPKTIKNRLKMANAEIYLSGQNLFLIYASQGIWDPEFSGNRDNYPIMRVYTVGARVSL